MTRILVTGGAGDLGREVVARLLAAGYTPRVMSRRAPGDGAPVAEWAQADLTTGAGLGTALAGVDAVVHAASSPFKNTAQTDAAGTRRLLDTARTAGVGHIIYISIVGIDQIPYAYYRHKLAAEALVRESGLPWSILRATQFHTLLDALIERASWLPLIALPTDLKFQTIDTGEVAARLVEAVAAGPAGRLPDIGGPEVLTLGEMAREWLAARGQARRVVHLPLPGGFAAALRQGRNTCPGQRYGTITWGEWARRRYAGRRAVVAS